MFNGATNRFQVMQVISDISKHRFTRLAGEQLIGQGVAETPHVCQDVILLGFDLYTKTTQVSEALWTRGVLVL